MLKLKNKQENMVLVDNEFKRVSEDIDIERIKGKIKELLGYKYRYTHIVNNKLFLEIKHICKVSSDEYEPLFEKVKYIGNQTIVKYENYFFENEEPLYFIIGCTGLIGGFFMVDDKIYIVKKSNFAPVNIEFYEDLISYITEKYHINEFEVEEIELLDETRQDYGIRQGL